MFFVDVLPHLGRIVDVVNIQHTQAIEESVRLCAPQSFFAFLVGADLYGASLENEHGQLLFAVCIEFVITRRKRLSTLGDFAS